jgi:hypothetical protein
MDQTFYTRYKEHMWEIRNVSSCLEYSNYVLNTGHSYGSVTDSSKVIKIEKREKHLHTLETYHIYKMTKYGLHRNDTCINVYNPMSDTLQEVNTR